MALSPRYELRPAIEADRAFVYHLQVATLKDYVDRTWGWDDTDQAERFERRFDPAALRIVVVDGQSVGMIQVERTAAAIRLGNIQIAPQHQGRGLGTAVIGDRLQEARATGRTVWLQVLRANPARRLYERLGFRCVGETSTHYQMAADPKELKMTMHPFEIVKAAIHHQGPARLPVRFDCFGCVDTAGIPLKSATSFEPRVEGEDEWGCVWAKTEMANMGQVKGHPIQSVQDLSRSAYPDYDDDSRYDDVPAALEQYQAEGKYVTASIFMVLFERMHTLYGFENVLCDLMLDRPAMGKLADHIVEVHLSLIENVRRRFGSAVHAFTMTDDWGTQQAAFVRSELWTDFFFPRYKRLFDAMHDGGYDVWVHSCGKVNEIVEGYIQAGVNVVNLQQPRALRIRQMGERYGGRIAFESLADIQHTLPTGERARVDADAKDLMRYWASPSGGFVFSDYGDPEAIGVHDPQIKLYMYERFSEMSERMYGNPLPEPRLEE